MPTVRVLCMLSLPLGACCIDRQVCLLHILMLKRDTLMDAPSTKGCDHVVTAMAIAVGRCQSS